LRKGLITWGERKQKSNENKGGGRAKQSRLKRKAKKTDPLKKKRRKNHQKEKKKTGKCLRAFIILKKDKDRIDYYIKGKTGNTKGNINKLKKMKKK